MVIRQCGACGQNFQGHDLERVKLALKHHRVLRHSVTVNCRLCGELAAGTSKIAANAALRRHMVKVHEPSTVREAIGERTLEIWADE